MYIEFQLIYGNVLQNFPVDLKELYIADSESSSIRALNLKTGGSRLLAGGDPFLSDNLFKVCFRFRNLFFMTICFII